MLDLFHDISERIHVERTDDQSGVVSTLYQNTEAYIYRGRDNTELGAVTEILSEFTVILMEPTPLDIQVGDVVVRGNTDRLNVTAVDNNYHTGFSVNHQRLITEQATA